MLFKKGGQGDFSPILSFSCELFFFTLIKIKHEIYSIA